MSVRVSPSSWATAGSSIDNAGFRHPLSENAFAVYLFHPPAIITLAILLHDASVPPLLKAALLTVAAAFVTFSFAALVLRRIPLLRRIL